ncbi:helix-turn-helix domain containing protein [Streptomyces sp. NPDC057694]|uniref:helix-turn-helix domain containing protein n=1 Tax=Streptomyces sp. NPDC057694 TaxID=3346216 RepID=UPI0036B7EA56
MSTRDEEELTAAGQALHTEEDALVNAPCSYLAPDSVTGWPVRGRIGRAAHLIGWVEHCAKELANSALGLSRAFTVRLHQSGYVMPSGSRTDSPGIRRDVIQRTDHTEERSYGSASTGGFGAADFARRVDAAGGDVTAAVQQWLIETGRIQSDAHIIHLEVRTWRPR